MTSPCYVLAALLFCFSLYKAQDAELTLSPTVVQVCPDVPEKAVFTCTTTDSFLTWKVDSFIHQFPDSATGNASVQLGEFQLVIESNNSAVLRSTATTHNATALGPSMPAISCFGSNDGPNITQNGYILNRGPPSLPVVMIKVDRNSINVSWSSTFCAIQFQINITTCLNDIITLLNVSGSITNFTHTSTANISEACARVTPIDSRGRISVSANSTNTVCYCNTTVLASSTPMVPNTEGNLGIILGVTLGGLAALGIVVAPTVFVVVVLVRKFCKCSSDDNPDSPRKKQAKQIQDKANELMLTTHQKAQYKKKLQEMKDMLFKQSEPEEEQQEEQQEEEQQEEY